MKVLTVVLVLLLLPFTSAARPARPPARGTSEQLRSSLRRVLADLQALRRANADNPDAASRARVQRSLARAIRRVEAALQGKAPAGPMSKLDHGRLVQALRRGRAPGKRLRMLRARISGELFTCAQAVAILGLFPVRDERISAAVLLWHRLVDRKRVSSVLAAVGDKRAQAELHRRLKFSK